MSETARRHEAARAEFVARALDRYWGGPLDTTVAVRPSGGREPG